MSTELPRSHNLPKLPNADFAFDPGRVRACFPEEAPNGVYLVTKCDMTALFSPRLFTPDGDQVGPSLILGWDDIQFAGFYMFTNVKTSKSNWHLRINPRSDRTDEPIQLDDFSTRGGPPVIQEDAMGTLMQFFADPEMLRFVLRLGDADDKADSLLDTNLIMLGEQMWEVYMRYLEKEQAT